MCACLGLLFVTSLLKIFGRVHTFFTLISCLVFSQYISFLTSITKNVQGSQKHKLYVRNAFYCECYNPGTYLYYSVRVF